MEIREAYEILSREKTRRAYDQERRLSGMDPAIRRVPTPQELLKQAQLLASDVSRMNAYRIDTPWLRSAIIRQLSIENITLLSGPGLIPLREAFLKELMSAMNMLPYPFSDEIHQPMRALSALHDDSLALWEGFMRTQKRKYIFHKWLPWIGVAATITLCLVMYWYGK